MPEAGAGRPPVEAVLFDWGGTLTPWHDIDVAGEAVALARAVVDADHADPELHARIRRGVDAVWARSRDEHRSATVADLFGEAGLVHDEDRLHDYRAFWEPHTLTDPDAAPVLRHLRESGLRVGVLSNTIWPRAWHEEWFRRDGLLDLLDADVYSSEVPWTKPAPEVFRHAAEVVGVAPERCAYVGDRLFEDVWGPQQVGMRAVHVPHSTVPEQQRGHSEGQPDAVVQRLAELPDVVAAWR